MMPLYDTAPATLVIVIQPALMNDRAGSGGIIKTWITPDDFTSCFEEGVKMSMMILMTALVLFGLCVATDNMIKARPTRRNLERDQRSYL